jgi:general secretion pathway protein K
VQGFNASAVNRLLPFVTALPLRTRININTAPKEVLAAVFPDLSTDEIANLVRYRDEGLPFSSAADIKDYRSGALPPRLIDQYLDVKSDFFLATLAITGDGAQVRQMALLQRKAAVTPSAAKEWPGIIWVKDF